MARAVQTHRDRQNAAGTEEEGRGNAGAGRPLDFAPLKQIVLVLAGAVRAFQAADDENRHRHRYQNGENARIDQKQVKDPIHFFSFPQCRRLSAEPCTMYPLVLIRLRCSEYRLG